MTAGPWTFPTDVRTNILQAGYGNLTTGSYKVALFTSSSNLATSSTSYAALTGEVASGNGYTTGGIAVTLVLSGTTSVTCYFSSNPVWTASGGSIAAYYAVLYQVSGNIIAYCNLDNTPATVTVTAGNTLTISDGSGNPVLTLA